MTTIVSPPRPRTIVLAMMLLGAALMLVAASQPSARATHENVILTGTVDADKFVISRYPLDPSRLLLCAADCFTRARSEIGTITVQGLDGDDSLTVHHGLELATNSDGVLAVSFNAGPGLDTLELCTAEGQGVADGRNFTFVPCATPLHTDVAPGASVDERVLTQSSGTESVSITVNDVASIRDEGPGSANVRGKATADQVDYRALADEPATGEVTVGTLAPYQFTRKSSVRLDAMTGPDRIGIVAAAGIDRSANGSCGPLGDPVTPVCVAADDVVDDTLVVSSAGSDPDQVALAAHAPGTSRLTGIAQLGAADLRDIDHVELTVQSADDALAVSTSASSDHVRLGSTPAGVTLAGDLATDATAYALPAVDLRGDGTAPLAVTVDTGAGAQDDLLEVAGTDGDDALVLRPTDNDPLNAVPDTPCTQALTTCLEIAPEGFPAVRATLRGVSQHLVQAGAGDDALVMAGSLAPDTTWRGGEGADTVAFRGTGPAVAVDLASGSVGQAGAGTVVATGTERAEVDAGDGSVTTTGTAAADQLTFRPTAPGAGSLRLAGHPMLVELSGVGGVNVLYPQGGDDHVVVEGTTGPDRFSVGRDSASGTNTLGVGVDSLLPIRLSGAESATLSGLGNSDEFHVTGTGGPATVTVDGGGDAGSDLLSFAVATADTSVSVDQTLGTGQLSAGGPAIAFAGIENVDVEGDGSRAITVSGSDGADTISQDANTVTVGQTTRVSFTLFSALLLSGGPADDLVSLAPVGTSGVSALTVDGDGGADTLSVRGTALSERIAYTPDGADSGTIALPGAPQVSFAGIEDSQLGGATAPPSGDTLVVSTPVHDGTLTLEPGLTFDSGTIRFLDVTGTSDTAAPLRFGSLGRGGIEFAGDLAAPADRVVLRGQSDDDVFAMTTRPTAAGEAAVLNVDQQLPVALPGVHTLVLEGLDGADVFRMPADHPLPGVAGAGVLIHAGGPDTGDRLDLTGGGGALAADLAGTLNEAGHAAIAHSGLERIDLAASAAPVAVLGGAGPDALTWLPTGPSAGVVSAPAAPELHATGLGSLLLDPKEGADRVVISLRTVVDDVTVARGAATEVAPAGLQPVVLSAGTEALAVSTSDGADLVRVVGSGGPGALSVDGGSPTVAGDTLRLETATADVAYAADPTSGRLGSPSGNVDFLGVETLDLLGDGTGALAVRGTDGPQSFTTGESPDPRISVDGAAEVTHAGFPDVTLAAQGGNDDLVVGYRSLGDIRRLTVDAGTGTDDRLTVADTTGTSRIVTVRPTAAGAGLVTATDVATTVDVLGTEALSLDGRGGDDTVRVVTPDGAQGVDVTPGAVADSGSVRVASLLPVDFHHVGAFGLLVVTDTGGTRVDALTLHGSASSESLSVDGGTGEVRLTGWVDLVPQGALDLFVLGGDGADTAVVSGPVPYRTTTFDGGAPDLGDRLDVQGPTGGVTVDLAASSITGYGGMIRFPGVVDLHTDVGGQSLTQVGTARDDALCYDPMAPRDGRLYIVGAPGGGTSSSICLPDQRGTNVLHTFTDVAHLTVDPGAGADEVIVNGTTTRDLVTIHALSPLTEVTVHPEPESGSTFRLPVHVVVATTESLVAAADNGSDSIDVTTYDSPAPVITAHGEGPATMRIADDMVVRDGTGAAQLHDTTSHTKGSGTVTAEYTKGSGTLVRVDYTGMENVTLNRDPKVDSPSPGKP